jgi:CHAT domain-containing protein
MLAGGKSFASSTRPYLDEIPEAVIESQEIAAIFNSEALTEDAFTPGALLPLMKSAQYIHLSTHGQQNAVAPAFHCLFMSPDEGGSDVLNAYEIYGCDLSATDLLTLSACETGLGRVDAGDNLGGLPASFLISGVRTLVATLWQVASDVSVTFFRSLYTELKSGKSKLDAFVLAQNTTRVKFPAYRDWGAFYMLGDWA